MDLPLFQTNFLKRARALSPLVALLATVALTHLACGNNSSSNTVPDAGLDAGPDAGLDSGVDAGFDAGPVDAGPYSECGWPGSVGVNAKGIGTYCTPDGGACPGTAPLCSADFYIPDAGEAPTYFCVLPCGPCDPDDFCGTGATCVCEEELGGCGCTPTYCSAIFPDGGNPPCDTDAG